MFTGLIEQVGFVKRIEPYGRGRRLAVQAERICSDAKIGDSVSVNGVCLTIVELQRPIFAVEAVEESVQRSNLAALQVGEEVNLERSLRLDGRLGGHFVQGHIDGTGILQAIERRAPGYWLRILTHADLLKFCVEKGSIALDGVSLTVAGLAADRVEVAVIPHTAESTTLAQKKVGAVINIEVDILGKYIYRFIHGQGTNAEGIDLSKLTEWGYSI